MLNKNLSTKDIFLFFKPFLKKHLGLAILGIVLVTCQIGFDVSFPFLYKQLVNTFIGFQGNVDATAHQGMIILVWILLVEMGYGVFWQLTILTIVRFESGMMYDVSLHLFNHVQGLSYGFHTSHFAGSTVRKIVRGVGAVENLIDRVWLDFLNLFLKVAAISVILFWRSWIIGAIMMLGACLYIAATMILMNRQIPLERKANQTDTKISGQFIDALSNNLTVKIFANEENENRRLKKLSDRWLKEIRKAWNMHTHIDFFQKIIVVISEFGLLFFSIRLWQQGTFTVGDIVFVQTYLIALFGSMGNLGRRYRDFRRGMTYAEEMVELANKEPTVQDVSGAKKMKVGHGGIIFKNISFIYEGEKTVLRGLTLTIKPGEKVALVGPSGGGKTTLTKLMFRFYDPQKGHIEIDHQDIKKVTQSSLRRSIGLVPQEPLLFHRPIGENIAYGRPGASQKEIEAAAKLAYIHDFIVTLPEGYGTYVGERGIKLSGGERQRVAIARAILENAPIIVLDEATSSLDSMAEQYIQLALQNLMKERTTVVIAHRLSTIMQMDRIVVIEGGNIIEEGNHSELLQKEDSLYKKLWSLQAGGFLESYTPLLK